MADVLPPRLEQLGPQIDALMDDHGFMDSLDALSERVIEQASALIHEHIDLWQTVAPEIEAEEMVTLVVGWILGMPGGCAVPEKRLELSQTHMIMAAYVAGRSMHNAARVSTRLRH